MDPALVRARALAEGVKLDFLSPARLSLPSSPLEAERRLLENARNLRGHYGGLACACVVGTLCWSPASLAATAVGAAAALAYASNYAGIANQGREPALAAAGSLYFACVVFFTNALILASWGAILGAVLCAAHAVSHTEAEAEGESRPHGDVHPVFWGAHPV